MEFQDHGAGPPGGHDHLAEDQAQVPDAGLQSNGWVGVLEGLPGLKFKRDVHIVFQQ